jgi:hypothetical protein
MTTFSTMPPGPHYFKRLPNGLFRRMERGPIAAYDQRGGLEDIRSRERQETAEASGLDDDFDFERETANGVRKLSRDQAEQLLGMCDSCSSLDQLKDQIKSITERGEDEEPQRTVSTGSMRTDDPDPHLRASQQGDRRSKPAMDSRVRFARGEVSLAEYERELNERIRNGGIRKLTGADFRSFAASFPDAIRVKNSY